MTLQNKLAQIGVAFAGLTEHVYHYWRPVKNVPCLIWAETGEETSFNADNHKREQRIIGTMECFTRQEFDALLDSVQAMFEALGMTWYLSAVQYEEETNLIHYTWSWGVSFYGQTQVGGSGGV